MPVVSDDTPPEWVVKLMEIVGGTVNGVDPVHVQVWRHEDEIAWHLELAPTLYEEDGEVYLRGYHCHLSPIFKVIANCDVIADSECVSITGAFEDHPVHIVIRVQPEEDEEGEDVGLGTKKIESPLPN